MNKHNGFTIVELLIVIVVIGTLAGIAVVAYSGITRQANDTAVQSDLKNLATKLEMVLAESGQYQNNGQLATLGFKRTKSAYQDVNGNLSYCFDGNTRIKYVVAGLSKSGTIYYISSENPTPQKYTGSQNVMAACMSIVPGLTNNRRGYATEEGWRDWVGGP